MKSSAPRQYAVIARTRSTATEVLLLPAQDGWSLPGHPSGLTGLPDLHADIADRFGLHVSTLDCVGRDPRFFLHECVDGRAAKEGRWFPARQLTPATMPDTGQRAALGRWLADGETGDVPGEPPWTRLGWYSQAAEWATTHLRAAGYRRIGKPAQPGMRAWSYQMRLPALPHDVYFKASPSVYRHEAAVSLLLSQRFPNTVAKVIAVDPHRNWMLTEDFGAQRMPGSTEITDAYMRVVPELARIQHGMAEETETLIAAGCPDHRLEILPDLYDELVHDAPGLTAAQRTRLGAASVVLRESCRRLAAVGLPRTLVHLDVWRGNCLFGGRGPLIFDWAESVLGHPLVSLDVVLRDLRAAAPDDPEAERRVTDAYLAAWADAGVRVGAPQTVTQALEGARPVGIVSRALTWRATLAGLSPDRARPYRDTVAAQLSELLDADG
ncbi:phosphotransferase [Streptomyces sp. AK04-3B]|uniref:phosphotransferase n=1 Tax=Streptomyces sp. AK04-3B TaxID=3028650 RepID=UPI0029ABEEB3|nr:phosphotransferase [Streptomyces sp. AK04-3B]MDX3798905.1 phosphotransferase [Streptomyces sp. AK04-3B]